MIRKRARIGCPFHVLALRPPRTQQSREAVVSNLAT
jgi:hypothetical protein